MKKYILISVLLLSILTLSGCNDGWSKKELDLFKSQNRTPPPIQEISKEKINKIDGIKYIIIDANFDYEEHDMDRYLPDYPSQMMNNEFINPLTASKEELCNIVRINNELKTTFLPCDSYDDAISALKEILPLHIEQDKWHTCLKDEQPFYICYNANANAYIISGSFDQKKFEHKTSSVAIEKGTGKLLMVMHW